MSAITQAAANYPCIRCQAGETVRACHYNGQRQYRLGKGRGIKGSDIGTAFFCKACDERFTEGTTEFWDNEDERSEEFLFYCQMTMVLLNNDCVLVGVDPKEKDMATIEQLVEIAARDLPENTYISINIESGYGGVDAVKNDANWEEDTCEMSITEQFESALIWCLDEN